MDYTLREIADLSATEHPGVDEQALQAVEQAIGAKFPDSYRELVKLVNAPEFFDWQFFSIRDSRHPILPEEDIVFHNTEKERPRFILPGFVIFAHSMGDYLAFKVIQGTMEDTVYVFIQEMEEPEAVAPDLKNALVEIMSYAEEEDDLQDLGLHDDEDEEE